VKKISIIVPTYNEERDVEDTIISLLNLSYDNYEILFVDDSSDKTPNIIRKYESDKLKLIRPSTRKGRCEARNIGVKNADGEILIILNADVHLPKDFIEMILPHYLNGADYVLVESEIENLDDLFARYVECTHKLEMSDLNYVRNMVWTEGFSVRRDIALQTSLFPSNFATPIVAGEDARFGDNLEKLRAKKCIDLSIVVKHVAPSEFKEYWGIRKGRGMGTPQVRRYLDDWSYSRIRMREYLKFVRFVLMAILIFPMLHINYKRAKFSDKNIIFDVMGFSYAWIIENIAYSIGAFQALREIVDAEKGKGV
jgi:glycosyltransferase involved in cell wall biosynthesis